MNPFRVKSTGRDFVMTGQLATPALTLARVWLEWQDWAYPILAEPFELSGGRLTVRDRPGSGIEWNKEAVKRFQQ
jgi:L-alanine-DL-glutamate epimerase-like enolase superfamily enzyme